MRIRLVPLGNADLLEDLQLDPELTLGDLLRRAPALTLDPLEEEWMGLEVPELDITLHDATPGIAVYRPPGITLRAMVETCPDDQKPSEDPVSDESTADDASGDTASAEVSAVSSPKHAENLEEREVVQLAYSEDIQGTAGFLRAGLSVLVQCDKLIVDPLWQEIVAEAGLGSRLLEVAPDAEGDGGFMGSSLRKRQILQLKHLVKHLKRGDVLVIPHLDLLAGGTDANLSNEGRELVEILYSATDRLVLAFTDRSLSLPEVLAARFAVRRLISGVPREVTQGGERRLLGEAFVTREEAARFEGYDPEGLYKNVAGMNPIRLRHSIRYVVEELAATAVAPVSKLYQMIRAFKAQTSASFEIPDVTFDHIGGYDETKERLGRALQLMTSSFKNLPEKLQQELIPKGFIFYGPPGTGKTLFAKAIANQMNATILVVSGPEITDMYVGESERKVRELFAEARKNAPAVLVFDEFDSIASQRSGRDDGGSRAGNAIVAQILTEMDGFRAEVPMLVIGTTNRLDIIDEALLRPSRFQAIEIGLPDTSARRAIAEFHAGHFGVEVSPELLAIVADATIGLNGDEIRSIFRDACVGAFCEDPPQPIDSFRLGCLVGQIRLAREQHQAVKTKSPSIPRSPNEVVRPSSDSLFDLVSEDAEAEPAGHDPLSTVDTAVSASDTVEPPKEKTSHELA